MPIPRHRLDNTCLLMIDVQERLLPDMYEGERLVERCTFLLRLAGVLDLPTLMTEQYVKGLGPTVEHLRSALPAGSEVIEKTRFSACVDPVRAWLGRVGRPNVLLAGIEAHVCVLQTGLDLLELGYGTFWISDAISAGEHDQIEPARRRLERHGCVVTGCVSLTYELLGDAAHPAFREVLGLVKSIRTSP